MGRLRANAGLVHVAGLADQCLGVVELAPPSARLEQQPPFGLALVLCGDDLSGKPAL